MNSNWYRISALVAEHLEQLAKDRGIAWRRNPPLPMTLPTGATRMLFVLHRGDRLDLQAGLRDRRVMRIVVGACVAGDVDAGLQQADEDHFAARDLMRGGRFLIAAMGSEEVQSCKEVELEPDLKTTVAPGSVLMTAFEVTYNQTYPSAAR